MREERNSGEKCEPQIGFKPTTLRDLVLSFNVMLLLIHLYDIHLGGWLAVS